MWTNAHQMTIRGKADNFDIEDLRHLGRMADLKTARADAIVREVQQVAARWDDFAGEAGLPAELADKARAGFRTIID